MTGTKRCMVLIAVMIVMLMTVGCTQQMMTKEWGGTSTIDLPPGQYLVNVTWKDANLWYLTGQAPAGYQPRKYTFKESSTFGLQQGTVLVVEH